MIGAVTDREAAALDASLRRFEDQVVELMSARGMPDDAARVVASAVVLATCASVRTMLEQLPALLAVAGDPS